MPWCPRPSLNTVCFSYITTSFQERVRGFKDVRYFSLMLMIEAFLFMFPASFTSCLFADADGSAADLYVYPASAVKGRWDRAAMFGPAAHILFHCPTVWGTKANDLCFGSNSVFLGYFLLKFNLEKHSAASFFWTLSLYLKSSNRTCQLFGSPELTVMCLNIS